jgi:uncharacterized membrane protein YfcA
MPDLSSPWVWALALTAAFCVGMSKTGFGGLGIVSVSLFAQLYPAKESTGALLPLLIFADLAAVWFYRRHANWPDLAKLLPATLAGIARETTSIRLGTLVSSATFRYPGPLAISVAEVDAMSGGRVEFGNWRKRKS